MKLKGLIFLILFILSTVFVSAQLDVTHTGPTYIQTGTKAEFVMSITNTGHNRLLLDINSDPMANLPSSIFEYILLDKNQLELEGGKTKEIIVTVKLKKSIKTNENYVSFIKLTSPINKDINIKHNFVFRVVPPEDIIDMKVSVPFKVEPNSKFGFSVDLENNLNAKLYGVKLIASSEIFEEERNLNFFEFQNRTENFVFEIDSLDKPKEYSLNLRLIYDDKIINVAKSSFQILENTEVKEQRFIQSSFFTKTYSVIKKNYGNTEVEETYNLKLGKFEKMFAQFSEEPFLKNDEGLHWTFSIKPNESYSIIVEINYKPLFIAGIVVIIFGILIYIWISKSVKLKKEILRVGETPEGISELKIMLHVKNNTNKTLTSLKLIEMLPQVIEPVKGFGTLKPEKIQKSKKGIRLMWFIPELVKGEERIISYKVKSKINIVGTFLLQPAKIMYKSGLGKKVIVKSNKISFTVSSGELK